MSDKPREFWIDECGHCHDADSLVGFENAKAWLTHAIEISALRDMEAKVKDLEKDYFEEREVIRLQKTRIEELEAAMARFKVWGTDGCRGQNDTCQGRITLFITDDRCLDCQQDQILKGESEKSRKEWGAK